MSTKKTILKEQELSPEELEKIRKRYQDIQNAQVDGMGNKSDGKLRSIGGGGGTGQGVPGGENPEYVPNANANKCPKGQRRIGNKCKPIKNTDQKCPEGTKPGPDGKCIGPGKKKKKGPGEGGDVTAPIDAGGTGTGPGGEEEKGKDKKPENPTTKPKDGETKPNDKDKPEAPEDDKIKDKKKGNTDLSAEDLEPFKKLNEVEVYWVGRGRTDKDKRKVEKVLNILYNIADQFRDDDEPEADFSKIEKKHKEKISNADWIIFPGYDSETYFLMKTRKLIKPKGLRMKDKRFWEYKQIPQQKEVEKALGLLQFFNGKRDTTAGLKNTFQQLSYLRLVIGKNNNVPQDEKEEWSKFKNNVYEPTLNKAVEIYKNYNKEKHEKDKARTAIWNSGEALAPEFKNIFIPKNNAPVATDTKPTPPQTREVKTMNKNDLRRLIREAFTDKVYGQYPYSHRSGDEEEPKEDYVEEWKRFCLGIVQDKSKERAIALAKVLIQDVELFEDVLDLAGQNQSIGSEILRKMQKAENM